MDHSEQKEAVEAASNRTALVLAAIIIAAALLRLPHINDSLWWDETCYTFMELSADKIDRLLFHDVHPPFYTLLMLVWVHLFGDGTITVRIPSLIFGLASLPVLFSLARDWFGEKTALLATAFMALSPVHIWHSQENKNNMVLMTLTLLCMYMVNRAWQQDRRRDWVWLNICLFLAIWTNHFALWVAAALVFWLWLQMTAPQCRSRLKPVLTTSTTVFLAFSPFALMILFRLKVDGWTYLKPFTPPELYKLFLVYLAHGNTIRSLFPWAPLSQVFTQPWTYFIVDAFFLALIMLGFFRLASLSINAYRYQRGQRNRSAVGYSLLPFYLFLPPALLMAASFWKSIYIERSMIILLPPFAMTAALGIASIKPASWRRGVMIGLAVIQALALYNLWWAKADQWTVWMPNPDWRSAAGYFANERNRHDDRFLIIGATRSRALNYYYTRKASPDLKTGQLKAREPLPLVELEQLIGQHLFQYLFDKHIETVYLIHNRHWTGAFPALLNAVRQDRKFLFEEKAGFKGLDIYKFILLVTKPEAT